MNIFEIILIAIGLAMDAFAVSICKGLSMGKLSFKKALIIGMYFGIFQALMPALGFLLGSRFEGLVSRIDHWIAFALLTFIGLDMIKEVFSKDNEQNADIDFKTMLILSIATSIDALAVGITFSFLRVNILEAILVIGLITFFISIIGVIIGNKFGDKYEGKAKFFGGAILILMGIKILADHLF